MVDMNENTIAPQVLADVRAYIAAREAELKEAEKRVQKLEAEARSARTHLEHDRRVLTAWVDHAAKLKEVGEFH